MPQELTEQERIQRERDAQNYRYSVPSVRNATRKYYSAGKTSHEYLRNLLVSNAPGKEVLEIGCGVGSYASTLMDSGAASVTAIDISEVAIEQARKTARPGVTHVCMNAESLQFPAASFDLVCGGAILHHLDLQATLPEIRRVLRPGGVAAFLEPLGYNFAINLYRRMTPRMRTVDETPFKDRQLNLIREYFPDYEFRFFNFLTLLCVPFPWLQNAAAYLDERLLRLPLTYRLAWIVVITLRRS